MRVSVSLIIALASTPRFAASAPVALADRQSGGLSPTLSYSRHDERAVLLEPLSENVEDLTKAQGLSEGDVPSSDAVQLPSLNEEQKKILKDIYGAVKDIQKFMDFANTTLPVTKADLFSLGKAIGGKLVGRVKEVTKPVETIWAYFSGIGECAIKGKGMTEAIECGKRNVMQLPERGNYEPPDMPEPCDSFLGQLEIIGTGWPAPCHDPNAPKKHPEGPGWKRALKRGACKAMEALAGERFKEASRRQGEKSCDERFPTNKQVEKDRNAVEKAEKALRHAKEGFPRLLEKVQKSVDAGGQVTKKDIAEAAQMIGAGALEDSKDATEDDSWKLAGEFLSDISSNKSQVKWIHKSEITAQDIPGDKEAEKMGFQFLTSVTGITPNRDLFQTKTAVEGSSKCYSLAGLAMKQPKKWHDMFLAMGITESRLSSKKMTCRACEPSKDGSWGVRCASTTAEGGKPAVDEPSKDPSPEPSTEPETNEKETHKPESHPEVPPQQDPSPDDQKSKEQKQDDSKLDSSDTTVPKPVDPAGSKKPGDKKPAIQKIPPKTP